MFSSWVLERIAIGDTHRLRRGLTLVGRHSSSDLRITDSHYVSRHHAEIQVSADDKIVTIKDLNSVNGVFLNSTLHQSDTVTVKLGDKLGIGVSVDDVLIEDELTLPIYELKYIPITRAKSSAMLNMAPSAISATQPNELLAKCKINPNELPSTSAAASSNVSTNSKQPKIIDEIFIISDDDDDDEDDHNNKQSIKKNIKEDQQVNEQEQINHNIIPQTITIKQEKLSDETSIPSAAVINKALPVKPIVAATDDPLLIANNVVPEIEVSLPSDEHENLPEISQEPSHHIPIISSLKKELIHSVSANVKNIFGDIHDDDDMKKKLKEMNPFVYNELTGNPLLPVTNVDTHLQNGDFIILSDDEAQEEDDLGSLIPSTSRGINEADTNNVETAIVPSTSKVINAAATNNMETAIIPSTSKGINAATHKMETPVIPSTSKVINAAATNNMETAIIPSTSKGINAATNKMETPVIPSTSKVINAAATNNMETAKSPNIFDSSLNESNDDNDVDDVGEQVVETNHKVVTPETVNQRNAGERLTTTANDKVNMHPSHVTDAADEDMEEFMFSQVLINDMKAEMQNDVFNADSEEELTENEENFEGALQLPINIKQEPDLERNASLLSNMENSCWVISDDEDFDPELETKVNDWSNKIFSQSFSNTNMSQVYDLDTCYLTDEEDNGDDEQGGNEFNGDDFNIIDDDIDNIADLYNNSNNKKDQEPENNIDEDLNRFKERLRRLNDDEDEPPDEQQEMVVEKVKTPQETDLRVNENKILEKIINDTDIKLKNVRVVIEAPPTKEYCKAAKVMDKTECKLSNKDSSVVKKSMKKKIVHDLQKEKKKKEVQLESAQAKDLHKNEKIIEVKTNSLADNKMGLALSEEKRIAVEDRNKEQSMKLKDVRVVIEAMDKEISEAFKNGSLRENNDLNRAANDKSPDIEMQTTVKDSPVIRARRKSTTKLRLVLSDDDDDDDGNDDANDFVPNIPVSAEQTNNEIPQFKENTNNNKSTIRQPPMIIDAPALPKCKGKLRGVSAVKPPPPPPPPIVTNQIHNSKQMLREKITSIRDHIMSDRMTKDLKRKWVEKSSVSRARDKEREKMIKSSRKDKLKELAEKNKGQSNATLKRKNSISLDYEEIRTKKAKVKVTANNRGAFLASAAADPPKSEAKSKVEFKIPKIGSKKPEATTKKDAIKVPNGTAAERIKSKQPLQRSNSTDEVKKKEPLKRTTSVDASFSQQIAMADELLLKKVSGDSRKTEIRSLPPKQHSVLKSNTISNANSSSNLLLCADNGKGTVCREAVAARALRTTNKITFASMEKNLTDTEACKEKLNTICHRRLGDNLNLTSCLANGSTVRPKKTVRFNDVPVIHYIERICGASRKVIGKDILPQTTNKDRRLMIRRTYPIIDNTDKIISKILNWSNEWLIKRDAAAEAASDIVYPMPTHFTSFDHYKSILFPLMRLEFASLLERQYQMTLCTKKYMVILEYVTENKDRLVLVTKFYFTNRQQLDNSRFDLVILESKQMNHSMFAYLTSVRKGAGSCNTMVFEILPINVTKAFFSGIKEFTVRPVIDNVRVEFGAFNAVYQLEATPLFKKILNPLELLQCRHSAKKKPIYRGCDQLNEKQKQVLLNTYSRIIDETSPNISLLQGPPGTGKSCVITNLTLQTLYGDEVRYLDKKILICAQSNAAVDVITSKLFDISLRMRPEKRFRLIRYGLPEKIHPGVSAVALTNIVEHELLKKLKLANGNVQVENKESLKNQIVELEAQIADMLKRNVKGTVEEDMLLEKQRQLQLMRNISNQLTRPDDERSLYTWYLSNANVVCATLSSCVKLSQYVNYFDICIIDEATQSTEPWTLLPLRFGINSLVLVGDTQQLPATILSKKAHELGLGKSMFTRIQNCLDNVPSGTTGGNAAIMPSNIIFGLQTQYRMNPEICRWPNQYFYRNELINGRITMEYKSPLLPFSVLNLAYTQNEYCSNGKITNNLEAEFVAKLLKALDGFIPNKYNSYGVITPYAHHRTTLENSIRSLGLTNIMVNTIDSYQGLEKDVIVISNARTNGIGFLSNPQRLNVALTRPKKCLILCGNFKSLEVVPAWRYLLQSARDRNLYYEISTNCVNDIQTNVIDKIRLKK